MKQLSASISPDSCSDRTSAYVQELTEAQHIATSTDGCPVAGLSLVPDFVSEQEEQVQLLQPVYVLLI